MQKSISIICEAFSKNPDGSWSSVQISDIQASGKAIRIPPGMIFNKNRQIWGIDIVEVLEETCQS